MDENILKKIWDHLKEDNFSVYFPAQHKGICNEEYVVIAYAGSVPLENVSSSADMYNIMCYVPENKYSNVLSYMEKVRDSMRKTFPLLRESGTTTVTFYDESVNGYMVSLEYANYRKIKYIR